MNLVMASLGGSAARMKVYRLLPGPTRVSLSPEIEKDTFSVTSFVSAVSVASEFSRQARLVLRTGPGTTIRSPDTLYLPEVRLQEVRLNEPSSNISVEVRPPWPGLSFHLEWWSR